MNNEQFQSLLGQIEPSFYNVSAYNAFVACLIARPQWIATAVQQVPPEWVAMKCYRIIYEAMGSMYFTGCANGWQPQFDAESIYAYVHSQGRGQEFDQLTNNCEVLRAVQSKARSEHFNPDQAIHQVLHDLRESALRLAVFQQSGRMMISTLATGANGMQLLATAQNDLAQLAAGVTARRQNIQNVGEGDMSLARCPGIRPNHLPKLCDLTGGFRPSTLSIICARTNVGKSVFMGSIALDVAVNQKLPVLYLDTEMGRDPVLRRAVAWQTGLDENMLFMRGGYDRDPQLRAQADAARDTIKASPFFHVDISAMDFEQAANIMRQFRRCYVDATTARQGLIIYDYLRAQPHARIPEWQVLGEMAVKLRGLAKELDLPLIAGMQGSRAAMQFAQNDYAENGIGIAAGSDRPAHHSDLFCVLRNLKDDEAQRVGDKFGLIDAELPQNRLRFNQVLHVNKGRGCPTMPQGIPLFYQHGTARYVERAYKLDANGAPMTDARGWLVSSEEIDFLHSRQFQRKTMKGSLPATKSAA